MTGQAGKGYIGVCAKCGRTRRIMAKGLCKSMCYPRNRGSRGVQPDWVVIEWLANTGPRADSRRKERRAAVGILLDRGQLSQRQIAERVGVSRRLVQRIVAERRSS